MKYLVSAKHRGDWEPMGQNEALVVVQIGGAEFAHDRCAVDRDEVAAEPL